MLARLQLRHAACARRRRARTHRQPARRPGRVALQRLSDDRRLCRGQCARRPPLPLDPRRDRAGRISRTIRACRPARRGCRTSQLVDELLESWTKTARQGRGGAKMLAAAVPCAPVRNLTEVMTTRTCCARQPAVDRPPGARPGRAAAYAAHLRGRAAPADRAEPAARREQRGDRQRLARPFQGRV